MEESLQQAALVLAVLVLIHHPLLAVLELLIVEAGVAVLVIHLLHQHQAQQATAALA